MKHIIKYQLFLGILLAITINYAAAPEKAKGAIEETTIKRIIDEKLAKSEEAGRLAKEAEIRQKAAESEVELYNEEIIKAETRKEPQSFIESLKKQQEEWKTKVKEESITKKQEEDQSTTLKEEADSLKKEQGLIESEFNPAVEAPKKDLIREEMEKCIKRTIIAMLDLEKRKISQSKQLDDYMDQLAQKMSELTFYERINFYKSGEFTKQQWQTIHQDATKNSKNYDQKYIDLLNSIEKLRLLVAGLLKDSTIELPTTESNDKCIVQFYPLLNSKIQQMEKFIGTTSGDSVSWNN